jgi:hypothetical protein
MEKPRNSSQNWKEERTPAGPSSVHIRHKPWYQRSGFLIPAIVAATLLILLLVVYFYKDAQVREVRQQAAQERESMIERTNERIAENHRHFLDVLTMPFSWAIRTALMAGNVDQVDQYLFQFVQRRNFEVVLVADANGNIISSTNQRYIGNQFGEHFNAIFLAVESTTVDDSEPNRIRVASPVMGLNTRLGTLFYIYLLDEPLQAQ